MVLIKTLARESFIGKLGNLVGKFSHPPEECLHIHLILWSNRSRSRGSRAHRIVDHTLPKALRLLAASLNLRGETIGDGDRDLHEKSVAG